MKCKYKLDIIIDKFRYNVDIVWNIDIFLEKGFNLYTATKILKSLKEVVLETIRPQQIVGWMGWGKIKDWIL